MKAADFIAATKNGDVSFDHSRHLTIQESVRDAVALALGELLDGDATVHYAYEISRLVRAGGTWGGTLDWVVVLDTAVLRIVGRMETAVEDRPAFHLAEHLMPARTLTTLVVEPLYMGEVHLRSVALKARFAEVTIEANAELPEGNAEGLLRLGRELRRLL